MLNNTISNFFDGWGSLEDISMLEKYLIKSYPTSIEPVIFQLTDNTYSIEYQFDTDTVEQAKDMLGLVANKFGNITVISLECSNKQGDSLGIFGFDIEEGGVYQIM